MDLQDIFISNLKRFRKERHLTQEQLAELCQTETSYIGQIEIKRRFPSLTFIEKIAEVLNIPPYYLYKPIEDSFSSKNHEMQEELVTAVTKDISDIFVKYGMV